VGRWAPCIWEGIPLAAILSRVYGPVSHPGWTSSRARTYRLVSTAVWYSGCNGERPWGSRTVKPMGGRPIRISGSPFLLMFVGPSAQSYSALPDQKV